MFGLGKVCSLFYFYQYPTDSDMLADDLVTTTVQRSAGLMLWGGINGHGCRLLHRFDGTVDTVSYLDAIRKVCVGAFHSNICQ